MITPAAALLAAFALVNVSAIASEPRQLDVDRMVNAIYRLEGGSTAKWLYGIRSVHYADAAEAKHICENTVRNNWRRWIKAGRPGLYEDFLCDRYCPASSDPIGNANWRRNVKRIYGEI